MAKAKTLKIKLIKSPIGGKPKIRKTVEALGLRKVNQVIERESSPVILGMIKRIEHLVEFEETG